MEWRKNLSEYEETPPDNAWEMISRELNSDVPEIREALYDYAEQPPVNAWQAIAAGLDQPSATPVYRYRKSLAYVTAAAAVLAGIMFFSDLFNDTKKEFIPEISASVYQPVAPMEKQEKPSEDNSTESPSLDQQLAGLEKKSVEELRKQDDQFRISKRDIAAIQPVKFDPDDENYIYLTTTNGEIKRALL